MTSNKAYAARLLRGAMSKVYVHLMNKIKTTKKAPYNTYYEDNFGIFRSEVWRWWDDTALEAFACCPSVHVVCFAIQPLGKEGDIVV